MFDKLVESTSTGAELGPRRRIFAVTLVLVTTLFATAVVASIYAADFDLGASNFDIAELLTPVTETEPPREIEPEPEQRRSNLPQSANNEIVRQVLMASTSDSTKVPDKISTEVNPYASTSMDKYKDVRIGRVDSDPGSDGGSTHGTEQGSGYRPSATDDTETKTPPPAAPKVEKKVTTISGGVMTGKATHLPKPIYSAAAKAVGAQGTVTIQILVDESGKVVSAKAVNGNIMLRQAAVDAAFKARFDPTYLSQVPVKVTGIITYNFDR
jgi:TonB family protein